MGIFRVLVRILGILGCVGIPLAAPFTLTLTLSHQGRGDSDEGNHKGLPLRFGLVVFDDVHEVFGAVVYPFLGCC